MTTTEVETLIARAFPDSSITVTDLTGTGDHFQARIASSRFKGLTMLKQHRLVYEAVQVYIDDGRIHALQLQTSAVD